MLDSAVERALDALVAGAVRSGPAVTWPSWELSPDGHPSAVTGGRPSLYDGDAGVAWALAELGRLTGRTDAVELAGLAVRSAGGRGSGHPGLLGGDTGIALAARVVTGVVEPDPDPAGSLDRGLGPDLSGGLAGSLLHAVEEEQARQALLALTDGARVEPLGCSWPDPTASPGPGRPLCGLAHGASGILLALVETAYRWPRLADEALALADAALRWEDAWFDPVAGGWPDLRDDDPTAGPALWCHGAVGIGLVRLRMVELAASGLGTPWPIETVEADAEAAVRTTLETTTRTAALVVEHGWGVTTGGLTLCHGLGGSLELLTTAARVWCDDELAATTRSLAAGLARCLPEDPWQWPGGLRGAEGVAGLFVGFAGTALTLARVGHPGAGLVGAGLLGLDR